MRSSSAMQDHFYYLWSNYGVLFLCKFQPLDQGPALAGTLIVFWVQLYQQPLNDIPLFLVMPSYVMSLKTKNIQYCKYVNYNQTEH